MKRYITKATTMGCDGEAIEGPYYRYFYERNMRTAESRLRENGHELFCDNFDILSLSFKRVGKNRKWFEIFNYEKRHLDALGEQYRLEREEESRIRLKFEDGKPGLESK